MKITQEASDGKVSLALSGKFDFNTHLEFRAAYEEAFGTPGIKWIEVNLSDVTHMDSSALGMLLMLKERVSNRSIELTLAGPQGTVRQVLEIANFGKLFKIT